MTYPKEKIKDLKPLTEADITPDLWGRKCVVIGEEQTHYPRVGLIITTKLDQDGDVKVGFLTYNNMNCDSDWFRPNQLALLPDEGRVNELGVPHLDFAVEEVFAGLHNLLGWDFTTDFIVKTKNIIRIRLEPYFSSEKPSSWIDEWPLGTKVCRGNDVGIVSGHRECIVINWHFPDSYQLCEEADIYRESIYEMEKLETPKTITIPELNKTFLESDLRKALEGVEEIKE